MQSNPVFNYLENLPDGVIGRLYEDSYAPWSSKAVFQSLNDIAKNYVMRLIFIETEISDSDCLCWFQGDNSKLHESTVDSLVRLKILKVMSNKKYMMNKYFQTN